MAYFNQDNRGGGNRFSGNSRGGSRFGGRDGGRPMMHKAVCDECGNSCEVPFRPTGDKPIYCSNCFESKRESGGYDGNRRNDRGFNKSSFRDRDKQMFSAVCDECGKDCEVPFKPSGDKPIYCSSCFEGKGQGAGTKGDSNLKKELSEINEKLDRLIQVLTPEVKTVKQVLKKVEDKTAKSEVKAVKTAAKKTAKKPVKKVVKKAIKKTAVKKAVKKK
jgi:CxxC-x17-CxxC domain-containing protein